MRKFIFPIILLALLIGCASAGKNFNYQKRNLIELNKTTVNETIEILGDPLSREVKNSKKGEFEILKYIYSFADPSGASARVFFLEFKNDILNAKIYNSGFKEDVTDFDFENYKKIKIGESHKEDVLANMGSPVGVANCPSTLADFEETCENNKFVWLWIHTKKSEGYDTRTIKSKTLKISFDNNEIVNGIETSKEL